MLENIPGISLVIGMALSIAVSILILARSRLDPGAVAQSYPLKDYCSLTVMMVIFYSIIVALYAIFQPLGTLFLIISGSLLVIELLYYPICVFVDRQQLIDLPYFTGICITISAPLFGNTASAILLALGLLLIAYGEENFDINYITRYKKWSRQKAVRYTSEYWDILKNYPSDLRKILLTIIILEDVARPRYFRLTERIYASICNEQLISTGIMQVHSYGPLSDRESVIRGCQIVHLAYNDHKHLSYKSMLDIARTYNGPDTGEKYLEMMNYFLPEAVFAITNFTESNSRRFS